VDTATGRLNGGAALLGTDLSNDHPIGIQYCGGGLSGSGTTVSGTCKDSDFNLPQTQVINGNQVFWIDTGGPGKQRTDLPLYQRTAGGLGPMVECASCHDPHVSTGQAGPAGRAQSRGDTFLRISNAVQRRLHGLPREVDVGIPAPPQIRGARPRPPAARPRGLLPRHRRKPHAATRYD
jgi:hypothetical protein